MAGTALVAWLAGVVARISADEAPDAAPRYRIPTGAQKMPDLQQPLADLAVQLAALHGVHEDAKAKKTAADQAVKQLAQQLEAYLQKVRQEYTLGG
jgi:hypothetical protein